MNLLGKKVYRVTDKEFNFFKTSVFPFAFQFMFRKPEKQIRRQPVVSGI